MRRAFSLITAIFVVLIMATIAMLVFSLSGKNVQSTTLQYRQEQAALLARSYTELAVMSVLQHDRAATGNCVRTIRGIVSTTQIGSPPPAGATANNGEAYRVETQIYYLGNNLNNCPNARWLNRATPIASNYASIPGRADAVAAVIIDVFVRYKDPNMYNAFRQANGRAPNQNEIPWLTYHRRTIQKI